MYLRVEAWLVVFFFFNDTATTEIYTLSLHDALPIYQIHKHLLESVGTVPHTDNLNACVLQGGKHLVQIDRKSTRLNSSH